MIHLLRHRRITWLQGSLFHVTLSGAVHDNKLDMLCKAVLVLATQVLRQYAWASR